MAIRRYTRVTCHMGLCLNLQGRKEQRNVFKRHTAMAIPESKMNELPMLCSAIQEQATEGMIMCDSCNGMGWLICDFCQAKKINVKSESNRIYRRCPSCRAVGYILCTKCKVFKCVTFPDVADGDNLVS